ncbi:methyltransferase domain-containing protein [Romboutsia sedimentorum]|uniref:methyltransferase domain-containing protein n=1 Tax=Romboutsia sedimentorum TaxID=1368474 RepID=UPI003A7F49C5
MCEIDAKGEGVLDRITFIKSSAPKLPFDENEFDVAVSCLTSDEVKYENDKTKVLKEALRGIKKVLGNTVVISVIK